MSIGDNSAETPMHLLSRHIGAAMLQQRRPKLTNMQQQLQITEYLMAERFDIKASQAYQSCILSDQTTFNVDNNAAGDLDKVLRLALVVKKQGADAKRC
ncbi:MAG: hypothetical protein ACLU6Y_16355 [Ruminococcus sp.]